MTKQKYTIKPLRFKKTENYEVWESICPINDDYKHFHYKFYFSQKYNKYCDYYHDNVRFDSFEEAVEWANKQWVSQIEKALTKV
tara:strand:+ start:842 stop:1093 length:252 start_codon:yes stop_codon:yes gene_type:complete